MSWEEEGECMTSFLLLVFSPSSALCGSLHTSYGGCVNVPMQSKHAKVSTAPFSVRTVPAKHNLLSLMLVVSTVNACGTADVQLL